MRELRLMERVAALERDPLRRERPDQSRLLNSILAHLRCMLNTRQGAVPIAPDYGVPDFLDFLQRYPDSVREIESSIRQAVELYEPRLAGVRVTFVPQEDEVLALRFQIEARVREGTGAKVAFETVVETEGRISIRH
jgi:type VI secretion system protein